MEKTQWIRKQAADCAVDLAAGMLIALGTYNFAAEARFPMAGINGIALIFYQLLGTPIGLMAILLNIPVALLCFRALGRGFLFRSLRSNFLTSLVMDYVAPLLPVYTGDRLLAALCTGVLSGLGYALIFSRGSSTGGTDFVSLYVQSRSPHLSLGKITFVLDFLVVLLGAALVSRDMDSLIYGVLISFLLSAVMDKVLYGMDAGKLALIITDCPREVADRISQIVDRGSTFLKAEGTFSGQKKDVVLCACNNKQMYPIRRAVKELDPRAFIIILESNEVLGEGFKAQ